MQIWYLLSLPSERFLGVLPLKNVRNAQIWAVAYTVWKVSKYGVISGPYFPVFGLNTEIYSVNSVRIQENADQK